MSENKKERNPLFKLNEGKFCIGECSREIIPIENDMAKLYCVNCDRILRILKKKQQFKDIE